MSAELSPRVGYIGTGWTERVQIPAFTLGGLIPQAIASGQLPNAERVAEKFSIPEIYDDWRELVASENVDVVSICTPPSLHKEMAITALEAGKHVICEKPMALNTEEAEAMFAAAQAHPGQLAIIDHEMRFHPVRIHMRQLIRDGAIGAPLRLDLDRVSGERLNPELPWTWWTDASMGGGMLGAIGSHLIDLSRWLAGRIDYITGQTQIAHFVRTDSTGARRSVTADDHADILLRFANGARGRIVVSGITPGPSTGMNVLVAGSAGALKIDGQDRLWIQQGPDFPSGEWREVPPAQSIPALADSRVRSTMGVGSFYLAQAVATALSLGDTTLPEAASFYDGLVVQRALDAVRGTQENPVWSTL